MDKNPSSVKQGVSFEETKFVIANAATLTLKEDSFIFKYVEECVYVMCVPTPSEGRRT